MNAFIREIRKKIEGEVRDDRFTRRAYSVDASLYEIEPLCVITPKNTQEIALIVQMAAEYHLSVIPRGAATGITGGCLGSGVILDLSKQMNRILHVDYERQTVTCEPGVIQDQLNAFLAPHGFRLGPDTSTGNRATLGGMLANNAAGARSLKYGTMVDHILEVKCVLSGGEILHFKEADDLELQAKCAQQDREGEIYRSIEQIRQTYQQEIIAHFPRLPRRVSGYNLDKLIQHPHNLAQLIAGSEGSLAIVTEMTLKIVPVPRHTGLCLVHFEKMIEGMQAIEKILAFHPISVEMIDRHILEAGKLSPSLKGNILWLKADPEAVFAIELEDDHEENLLHRLAEVKTYLQQQQIGFAWELLTESLQMSQLWELRKSGLGLLLSKRSYTRAVAFIEDLSIPPASLASFMTEYQAYMRQMNKESGIYGHVGSGCLHIRPYINLRSQEDFSLMPRIMEEITQMVIRYKGSLSGEHGDGLVRSWLNRKLFGESLYSAFVAIKRAFDPHHQMNPGKIVDAPPFEENQRLTPFTMIREIDTFLDFSKEGGFALSADLCNGNGLCRKKEGVMCPSFQATGDEYDTTRARAQALRSIVTGRTELKEIHGQDLHDILDLCIGCKGCKKECPSQVDMAKMKTEVLYQYHKIHSRSVRDHLFGFIGAYNNLAFPLSTWINHLSQGWLAKKMGGWLGIDTRRDFPTLTSQPFSRWAEHHPSIHSARKVVLFSDTFTEFHIPHVGIAAKEILERLGYSVIVPRWTCCGRTLLSKGFLPQAKRYAQKLVALLGVYAQQNIPIVGLEPSCILALRDDYQGLLGYEDRQLQQVSSLTMTLDEFLYQHLEQLKMLRESSSSSIPAIFHGHCHQKASSSVKKSLDVLEAVLGASPQETQAGCCGMAGAFGYESEHYDLSVQIAQLQLIPALKKCNAETLVITNGFSCRQQIEHLTAFHPLHLAEVVRQIC